MAEPIDGSGASLIGPGFRFAKPRVEPPGPGARRPPGQTPGLSSRSANNLSWRRARPARTREPCGGRTLGPAQLGAREHGSIGPVIHRPNAFPAPTFIRNEALRLGGRWLGLRSAPATLRARESVRATGERGLLLRGSGTRPTRRPRRSASARSSCVARSATPACGLPVAAGRAPPVSDHAPDLAKVRPAAHPWLLRASTGRPLRAPSLGRWGNAGRPPRPSSRAARPCDKPPRSRRRRDDHSAKGAMPCRHWSHDMTARPMASLRHRSAEVYTTDTFGT